MSLDHERRNRDFWDRDADDYQAAHESDLSSDHARAWGAWRIPEAELNILGPVDGLDVLEYGCGAAQWSIALSLDGAWAVGFDQSRRQLAHAERISRAQRASVPLICASGEAVPFRDASFDIVFCDHGAMSFCDPAVTVPQVARLLRPNGLFAFSQATPLLYLTWNRKRERQSMKLQEPYFGMSLFDFGEGTIDFSLPHGEWIRLLREHGFVIEDLIELQPPEGAASTYTEFVPYSWARQWPAEQIWKARLA